jgi:ADP-ribose pyrophosphatase
MNTDNERRLLAEGKFLRLVAQSGWEWVERTNATDAAVIAAVTEDGCLVLVEQYRIPMHCRVVDLPAGLSGDDPETAGEATIDAARRELFEEAGYEGSDWRFAVHGPASPGLTTESYSLFIVRDAKRTGAGGGDQRENIEVHTVLLAELDAWLDAKRRDGVIVDPKIYVGRYFLESSFRGST